MVKKITLLAILSLFSYFSYAQCTPDESSISDDFGVAPATFTKVCQGTSVDRTLTIAVPNTVDFNGNNVDLISVNLTSYTQVPDGLTLTPKDNPILPSSGTTTYSCVQITGVPTTVSTAPDTLVYFNFQISASTGGFALPTIDSTISVGFRVLPSDHSSCEVVNSLSSNRISEFTESINIYPNPVSYNSTVEINLTQSSTTSVEIFDILGKSQSPLVNFYLTEGYNELSIGELANALPSGIYLLKVNIAATNNTIVKKIYVK